MNRRLPQLELECIRVLWKQPAATVAQVRAGLARPLAYTTVMTVLDRMAAKGVVARRKNGRAYAYSAVLDLDSARGSAVQHLLANLFDNDREALLHFLSPKPQPARTRKESRASSRPLSAAMDETLL